MSSKLTSNLRTPLTINLWPKGRYFQIHLIDKILTLYVIEIAPTACLHFYVDIREIDHVFVEKELLVFVLTYFANLNCCCWSL